MTSCGCTATECCQARHRALKSDARLMAAHARYIGTQRDPGYDDLAMWNCLKCHSTITVKVPAQHESQQAA